MEEAAQDLCSLSSAEFCEFEREFQKYTDENLRTHAGEDFMTEHSDSASELDEKIALLVSWWRAAQSVVIFTGAGISTSAGLPDYRGPQGVWTRKSRGEVVVDDLDLTGVTPTQAHRALAKLHDAGLLAHVATTNIDGLHRRTLPGSALSELHGNMFVEECGACGACFEREYPVRTARGIFEHNTGRSCETCAGELRDIIVNFGNTFEHVPSMEAQHDRAWAQCVQADLVVVLGSSLSVPTACNLPEECLAPRYGKADGGRLVIVNLQRTPKDERASLKIHAPCDIVMGAIEQALLGTPRAGQH